MGNVENSSPVKNRFPVERHCAALAMILSEKFGVEITVKSIREKEQEDKQAAS